MKVDASSNATYIVVAFRIVRIRRNRRRMFPLRSTTVVVQYSCSNGISILLSVLGDLRPIVHVLSEFVTSNVVTIQTAHMHSTIGCKS